MRPSTKDASGRTNVSEVTGSERVIPAQMIITALGFEPENLPILFGEPALETHGDGRIKTTSPTDYETSIEGIYAAGDIVRGASLVVWAIRDGRDAAAAIHQAKRGTS
jgi:glutamate synthase (NADPH/NADH) small chain